jgi:hypothetical protein
MRIKTARADENFVNAYLAWRNCDPLSRRKIRLRNRMIRRRRELIHAFSRAPRLAN